MGADLSMNSLLGPSTPAVVGPYSYTNITTLATTQIKNKSGVLHLVQVNAPNAAAGTITIWDSLTASGTKIATITTPASATIAPVPMVFDVIFNIGLTVQTTVQALDITVAWK